MCWVYVSAHMAPKKIQQTEIREMKVRFRALHGGTLNITNEDSLTNMAECEPKKELAHKEYYGIFV